MIYRPIVFNVAKVVNTNTGGTAPSFDYSQCIKEEYKDNSKCQIPNFTNKSISEFNNWYRNFGFITAHLNKINDTTKTNHLITSQNIFGKSIYELYSQNGVIEIDYIYNEEEENSGEQPGNNEDTGNENAGGSGEGTGNENNNTENTPENNEENNKPPTSEEGNNNNETPTVEGDN